MKRPDILDITTGEELKKWYWLKSELTGFAKIIGASYTGSKFEILERLANNLDERKPLKSAKTKITSKFNWHSEPLFINTPITDSYKNTQNVRRFFKAHCGTKFNFSIPLMAWMKENTGKELKDAIAEWERLKNISKEKDFKSKIPGGNQYNKYLRDFFADNPGKTIKQARYFWKLKRSLPLGKHVYERSDLELKEK